MSLADLVGALHDRPVAAALELGSLLACVALFTATVVALASGPPVGRGDPWLAIIVLGGALVFLWTVVVPAYQRLA